MNIRLRLTLWYTAILSLILVIFGVIVYFGLSRSLLITTDDHLRREAAQIIGEIKFESTEHSNGDEETAEQSGDEHSQRAGDIEVELEYVPEEGVFWRILDSKGRPFLDPGYFDGAALTVVAGEFSRSHFEYSTLADGTPIRLFTAPFVIEGKGAGVIQIAESYQEIQTVQRQLVFLLVVSIPFVLLIASAGGWFMAANALAPIDRIARMADQISAKDLSQRLNLDLPNDEVGRLAATFDKMLVRLEDAFERQRRFIADASHEMRTPLTILKGDVEVALNRPRSAESYRQTLEMVNQTTDRLTDLVEELLMLARADNNQYPLELEDFDLADLLANEVKHFKPRAQEKDIALRLDAPRSLPIRADRDKLARLFLNLIDNAIKYSQSGDHVNVTAVTLDHQIRVDITDTGPGIPPEHLESLFDRFYRVDKARSRDLSNANGNSGAGLGLSIAQWLAEVHQGRIDVTSEIDRGTTFTVHLPLEPVIT